MPILRLNLRSKACFNPTCLSQVETVTDHSEGKENCISGGQSPCLLSQLSTKRKRTWQKGDSKIMIFLSPCWIRNNLCYGKRSLLLMLIIVSFRVTVIFPPKYHKPSLLPAILLDPIQQNIKTKSRIDFTDVNRTVHALAVKHTIKNFAEKGLDYFSLLFNVAYNVSHYFLLFIF